MSAPTLTAVPVHHINVNGRNPRRDLGDLTDLAASIAAQGILEPLVIAPGPSPVEHTLIAGHRRLAAARQAGLTEVPAVMLEHLDTPAKQLEAMLVENTQRTDLTPVEEATALQQLLTFPGYTVTKVAKAVGRSRKTVASRVAIAGLPEPMLARIHSGQVTLAEAETLAEWAGTPHYENLSRQIGTSNFPYAVQMAKRLQAETERRERVAKAVAEHGWPTVEVRYGYETSHRREVLLDWHHDGTDAQFAAALAQIDGEVEYVTVQGVDRAWSLTRPPVETPEDDTDDDEDDDERPRAAWEIKQEQARAEREAARVAATARWEHILAALTTPGTPPPPHLGLAYVVSGNLDEYGIDDQECRALGIDPQGPDEDEQDFTDRVQRAVAGATVWRLVACLVAGRAAPERIYSPSGEDAQAQAALAVALGYVLSDVEREQLAGAE